MYIYVSHMCLYVYACMSSVYLCVKMTNRQTDTPDESEISMPRAAAQRLRIVLAEPIAKRTHSAVREHILRMRIVFAEPA